MREAGQGVSIYRVGEGREGAVGYAGDDGIGGKHVDERQGGDGSDEDVAGEGNKVHGGTVEAAVGRGYLGSSPDPGCEFPAFMSPKNTGERSLCSL